MGVPPKSSSILIGFSRSQKPCSELGLPRQCKTPPGSAGFGWFFSDGFLLGLPYINMEKSLENRYLGMYCNGMQPAKIRIATTKVEMSPGKIGIQLVQAHPPFIVTTHILLTFLWSQKREFIPYIHHGFWVMFYMNPGGGLMDLIAMELIFCCNIMG